MIDEQDIYLLAQLVNSEGDATDKLEEFKKKNDFESYERVKKEILIFQKQISGIIEKWA